MNITRIFETMNPLFLPDKEKHAQLREVMLTNVMLRLLHMVNHAVMFLMLNKVTVRTGRQCAMVVFPQIWGFF